MLICSQLVELPIGAQWRRDLAGVGLCGPGRMPRGGRLHYHEPKKRLLFTSVTSSPGSAMELKDAASELDALVKLLP